MSGHSGKNKAFFFDRDGIVNVRIPGDYIKKITEFVFIEEFFEILTLIKRNEYLAILITNQQGIGKNLMSEPALDRIHDYMQLELMDKCGYCFDDIYYCPDLKDSGSFRRKPQPGMFLEAIDKWNISPEKSFLIGDSESDAIAAKKVNVTTILIGWHEKKIPEADYIFPDIIMAHAFLTDYFKSKKIIQ